MLLVDAVFNPYQLRYGDDVNHDFVRGLPGFGEDVYQQRLLLSTVIYF